MEALFTARGGTNPGSHKPRWMINPMQSYTKFLERSNIKGKKTPDSLNCFRDYLLDVRCMMVEGRKDSRSIRPRYSPRNISSFHNLIVDLKGNILLMLVTLYNQFLS